MAVDYNEELKKVDEYKQTAYNDLQVYDDQISEVDRLEAEGKQNIETWKETESKLQQDRTDFAIEQIEQQKEQTHKDYLKEQTAAHVDYQKAIDPYGVNAELMASQGLNNSGYAETVKARMFSTYQNRVATARDSYNRAVLNCDNAIKDAQMQNNSILAEIAKEAMEKSFELTLSSFQYRNNLVLEKADKKTEIDNTHWSRYQDVLAQIEQQRQFNETQAIRAREMQLAEEKFQYQKEQEAKAEEEAKLKNTQSVYTYNGSSKATGQGAAALNRKNSSRESGQGVNRGAPLQIDHASKQRVLSALGIRNCSAEQFNSLIKQGVIKEVQSGYTLVYFPGKLVNKNTLPKSLQKQFGLSK